MSIKIKNITMKNFLSIGNVPQSVNFDTDGLTLVIGENRDLGGDETGSRNGCGKTAIVQGISFALYGSALNSIKKDNLINGINGSNMLVSLTFSKNNVDYKIERGRKPSILKFYKNNIIQSSVETDVAQGDNRETQKELTEILGMTQIMFNHIVALNTYTEPFLSMRANDQRTVIEELLGITILSEKAESLKECIKETKELIFIETTKIESEKKSNEKFQQSIDSLRYRQNKWTQTHTEYIEKLGMSIIDLENVNIDEEIIAHSLIKSHHAKNNKLISYQKEEKTLKNAISQADKTVSKYTNELNILTNKKCHACGQDLHDDSHFQITNTTTEHLNEATKYLSNISNKYELIKKEISAIGKIGEKPDSFYETLEEALTHQANLQTLKSQLIQKSNESDPFQEQIDDLLTSGIRDIDYTKLNELVSLKEHQEFLLKLLTNKDSFIRKKIIDQNLPYLNNRLSYYINQMGLPHSVIFKNDLSVDITQLGQDLDFHNLSRGEMNRVILATSFSFRDVWESLYHDVNLLFCDELVDHGMDTSGVENALSVLKKMARERKKNIFLISHKDELSNRVNNILKVIKENNFTSYSVDTSGII